MSTLNATDIRALIGEELDALVGIRHDLHRHPELGYEERRTSGVVQRELDAAGIEFKAGLAGGTGVLGSLPGTHDRAIGLRADMDALPIVEESGVPHASEHQGVMHACGHDGHTTILIGAARVLARIGRDNGGLPRPVTFTFQPAEEGGAGGRRMVEDGCLTGRVIGPPVEHMFGLHGWPRYPLGVVGTRVGPLLAAADMFEIELTGLGGHAAMPHTARDPIVAGSAIVTALQTIASRTIDPLDSIVVSTTQFHGGTTHNIIPERVKLAGTVRTLLPETQAIAMERIEAIAQQVGEAYGCTAKLTYEKGYPVTRNAEEAVGIFDAVATDALGGERVLPVPVPVMGGEDFSFYCNEIPSCFFVLGLLPEGVESVPSLHHPRFDFNDDAIATGVEMFVRLALRENAAPA